LLFWGDLWVFELFVGVLGVTVLPQLSELEIAVLGSLGLFELFVGVSGFVRIGESFSFGFSEL
jgi:hypothetical protein